MFRLFTSGKLETTIKCLKLANFTILKLVFPGKPHILNKMAPLKMREKEI